MSEAPRTLGEAKSYRGFLADMQAIANSNDPEAIPKVRHLARLMRQVVREFEGWRKKAVRAGLDDFECEDCAARVGVMLILIANSASCTSKEDIAFFTEQSRKQLNEALDTMASWFQPEPNA